MPGMIHRSGFPGIAASAINAGAAVVIASGADRNIAPIATTNVRPFGIALASGAIGDGVTVMDDDNTVIVTAIASLGRGAEIGVASTNGGLAPVSGASGGVVFSVGQSISAAAAGEDFSLNVNPRQLSGLV